MRVGALGEGLSGGEQLVVGDAAKRQAQALGLGALEHLAGEDHGRRHLRAHGPLEHPGVPAPGVEPDLEEPRVEPTGPAHHPDVAAEREVHPRSHGRSVDGGDREQRAARHLHEGAVDVAQPRLALVAELRDVGAGAEGPAPTGDDQGADALVGLGLLHRRIEPIDHLGRQQVAMVRVVEGDRPVALGPDDLENAHGCSSALVRGLSGGT